MEQAFDFGRTPSGLSYRKLALVVGAVLLAIALVGSAVRPIAVGAAREGGHDVAGGGKTIIEGGTGGPHPIPVTTILGFHASGQSGSFECLALAPENAVGPESGTFEINAMYVTGRVTSVMVRDGTATLKGTATVTGLGEGPNQPFTFVVHAGGPGTTATLDVSGLTFHEILLEGQVTIH
jgi:hypothetical protein